LNIDACRQSAEPKGEIQDKDAKKKHVKANDPDNMDTISAMLCRKREI
jgi:hypothetical protein